MKRPRRIDQVIPTIVGRDAVGNHTFEAEAVLRSLGFTSEIFAERCSSEVAARVRRLEELGSGAGEDPSDRWLIYQSSIGSDAAEVFAAHNSVKLLDYHNITPAGLIGNFSTELAREVAAGRRQLAELAPRVALGMADSSFNADELTALGCREAVVVPLMIDWDNFDTEPDRATAARLSQLRSGGGTDWLFVGQISPHKGQHDLVKAFAYYREAYDPSARLWIVGRETSASYVTKLLVGVAELGLSEAVHFVGAVPPASLAAYYRGVDVFVCCSAHEGFCAPLIEAMHHRLPIVAYGAAAVPETLGRAGVLLDSPTASLVAAGVHRVVSDPVLKDHLVREGERRAATFALAATRARFAEAIASLLARPADLAVSAGDPNRARRRDLTSVSAPPAGAQPGC